MRTYNLTYNEAIAYLESLMPGSFRPLLEKMAAFMATLDNIQDSYKTIHIAGTNGKGSVTAYLDCVLKNLGYKTGRYSGPHILHFNERIHINGQAISDRDLARLISLVKHKSQEFALAYPEYGALTWYEILTVCAFLHFKESAVDIAVIEVGLGGRYDASNVLSKPLSTAITTIGLDHTHILGDTKAKIAYEKAGIIKESVPVVTATTGEALEEIKSIADKHNSPVYLYKDSSDSNDDLTLLTPELKDLFASSVLSYKQFKDKLKELNLWQSYQCQNAALSLLTLVSASLLDIGNVEHWNKFFQGLKTTYWPGRLQLVSRRNILMDCAHNEDGAKALRSYLNKYFQDHKLIFVISMFENKNAKSFLENLLRENDTLIACQAELRRASCPKETLQSIGAKLCKEALCAQSISAAIELAQSISGHNSLVITTGSFVTVKETMLYLNWESVEDGLCDSILYRG